MFPALLNCAQSPELTVPPPNKRLDPSKVHVLVAVQPYRFCPAGADMLKNVAPTEQDVGSTAPVCDGLVDVAAEKSTLLACVRKSTNVWASNMASVPSKASNARRQDDFMFGTVL
jgi:hypothetical protein